MNPGWFSRAAFTAAVMAASQSPVVSMFRLKVATVAEGCKDLNSGIVLDDVAFLQSFGSKDLFTSIMGYEITRED